MSSLSPNCERRAEPLFVFPILAGVLFGVLSWRKGWRSSAMWVWLLPVINHVFNIFTWRTGGFRQHWIDVWNNFFGSQCGSSECAYEVFVTAPMYRSVAYIFGIFLSPKTCTTSLKRYLASKAVSSGADESRCDSDFRLTSPTEGF